jgi:hypothetical protein
MTLKRTSSILKKKDSKLGMSKSSSALTLVGSETSEDGYVETTRPQNNVKFDSIQVRNYSVTLGDNPSCAYGPPLTLDWEYDERDPISVDQYEGAKKNPPRKVHQMHLLSRKRQQILKEAAGITDDEMEMVMDEMRKIQKDRNMTKVSLPFAKLQEASESIGRKWNRLQKNGRA